MPYGRVLPSNHDGLRFLELLESPWYRGVARLQSRLALATAEFWGRQGVLAALLPITTGSISSPMGLGSDSSPVEIELFGRSTYLADSMQFGLEYMCRLADGGAWYLMPSFRGERADESHLCQFVHSEVEIPCTFDECLGVAERYVCYLTSEILKWESDFLSDFVPDLSHLDRLAIEGIERMSFEQAFSLLSHDSRFVTSGGGGWRGLTRAGEVEVLRHVGRPVWITHWDHLSVPFYQAFDPGRETSALCADLLMGLGEVLGLGERHASADDLRRAMAVHSVDEAPYSWYVQMREAFPIQTSGFGLGTERFLAWITGHPDVRDFQILPRHYGLDLLP